MFIDSHIHNKYSSDGKNSVENFCLKAKEIGLTNLSFTNHAEKFSNDLNKYIINVDEFKIYYENEKADIEKAKEKYPDLDIFYGVELENRKSFQDQNKIINKNFEFDVILGSAHVVDDVSISNIKAVDFIKSKKESYLYPKYFEEVLFVIKEFDIDILAHIDIIKRYGTSVYGEFNFKRYKDYFEKIFEQMKLKNIALEVNTSGIRQEPKNTYPGINALKLAKEYNLDITVGSDAHSINFVGYGITDTYQTLKNLGFDKVCYFKDREKILSPL